MIFKAFNELISRALERFITLRGKLTQLALSKAHSSDISHFLWLTISIGVQRSAKRVVHFSETQSLSFWIKPTTECSKQDDLL